MEMGNVEYMSEVTYEVAYKETYYGHLVEHETGRYLYMDPGLFRDFGLEKAVVLTLTLEAEFESVANKCRDDNGVFTVSIKGIADSAGLSIEEVADDLEQLSDLSTNGPCAKHDGAIHIVERGSEKWRVCMGPDFFVFDPESFIIKRLM
jgi:hypothetical protein